LRRNKDGMARRGFGCGLTSNAGRHRHSRHRWRISNRLSLTVGWSFFKPHQFHAANGTIARLVRLISGVHRTVIGFSLRAPVPRFASEKLTESSCFPGAFPEVESHAHNRNENHNPGKAPTKHGSLNKIHHLPPQPISASHSNQNWPPATALRLLPTESSPPLIPPAGPVPSSDG